MYTMLISGTKEGEDIEVDVTSVDPIIAFLSRYIFTCTAIDSLKAAFGMFFVWFLMHLPFILSLYSKYRNVELDFQIIR